jgi:hypothetical protein
MQVGITYSTDHVPPQGKGLQTALADVEEKKINRSFQLSDSKGFFVISLPAFSHRPVFR